MGERKTYRVCRFLSGMCATTIFSFHFLYGRSVIFFITTTWFYREGKSEERERERERGWRKRDKSADKRLRFIASLILFIDTRIALRLRSQATTSAKFSREIRSCKNAPRVVYPHNFTAHARTFLPYMSIIHIYQTAHSISCR